MTHRKGKNRSNENDVSNFLGKYEKKQSETKLSVNQISNSRSKYLPSELKSYKKDDAYLIFSANGNYISLDTDANEKNILREKKNISRPIGSCKYMASYSLGNSFDPFVFCNIKRENENNLYKHYINIYDKNKIPFNSTKIGNSCSRYNTNFLGYENINLEREISKSKQDLKSLEKMLWYRSKPRLEKPYRIVADQKNCVKNCASISNILRKGM